jgi:16S rRNA (guanine(966)-N(2))-methyltransferase RsmD
MRISGGAAKGRKVGSRKAFVAKGPSDELRPTAAKVRKAVFDIIAGRIDECRFLDLYAGTGAVGIEALSRGADDVVFVEGNTKRADMIKDLIAKFGFAAKAAVIKSQTGIFLRKSPSEPFDIIFVDPPYTSDELELTLQLIDSLECLTDGGIVIAEHASRKSLSLPLRNLKIKKNYRYGDTALTLFEYSPAGQAEPVPDA